MISSLDSHLGYWLRFVSNHVSHGFARKLAGWDVTPAEWVVLRVLHDAGPVAPSGLAARLGMTRGAITKLADRLIAKRLLSRKPDPEDGRAQLLAITVAGRRLVPRLASLADANDAEFFGHLTAGDRRVMERVLRDIVDRCGLEAVPTD